MTTWLARVCVCGGLLVAPELLGGVYPWGMLVIAGIGLLGFGLVMASEPRSGLPATALVFAIVGALVWTALQACPLPCAVVDLLVPTAANALRRSHELLGLPAPSLCTLSHDPGATREEIVKGIAITTFFAAALALSRRGYRRMVLGAVVASGTLLALIALAHAVVGAERVFGVYQPIETPNLPLLAPVLNPNALGGLLAMCVPLAIGLALIESSRRTRIALLCAAATLATCVLMTRSRGAIGALVLGLGLLAVLLLRRSRRITRIRRPLAARGPLERMAIPIGVAAVLAVVAYGAYDHVLTEFRMGTWDKLELIAAGAGFTLEHPWVGVGRGAFGAMFVAVHTGANRFEHAENFPVQWASEWGIPVTLCLIAVLGYSAVQIARRTDAIERLGGLAGVSAIAAQNLVDLGLELVGVAAIAAATLGATVADRPRRQNGDAGAGVRRKLAWVLVASCASLLLLLAAPVLRDHTHDLEQRLRERSAARDRKGFRALLARALLAHPSEPIFPVFAATEALQYRDPGAGRFVNRGMQLAPLWATPHLQAAQWLFAAGRTKQALLELGVAAGIDPWGSRVLLCPAAAADPIGVAAVAPKDPAARLTYFFVLGHDCLRGDPVAGPQIDAIIMREFPNEPGARLRDGRRRLERGDAWGALSAADHALAGAIRTPEQGQEAAELRARSLIALGRQDDALGFLREYGRAHPDATALIGLEAEIHVARGDHASLLDAVARLRGRAGGSIESLARVFLLEAQWEERLGNHGAALRALEEAYRITGDTSALYEIAEASEKVGDRGRAVWAYDQLCGGAAPRRDACARRDALLARGNSPESPDKAAQPSSR